MLQLGMSVLFWNMLPLTSSAALQQAVKNMWNQALVLLWSQRLIEEPPAKVSLGGRPGCRAGALRGPRHDAEEYLRVGLPGGVQLVHPIRRGERFPINFGRDVAAAIAGTPDRLRLQLSLAPFPPSPLLLPSNRTRLCGCFGRHGVIPVVGESMRQCTIGCVMAHGLALTGLLLQALRLTLL